MKHGPLLLGATALVVAGGLGWFLLGTDSTAPDGPGAAERQDADETFSRPDPSTLTDVDERPGAAREAVRAASSDTRTATGATPRERLAEATGPYTGRLVDALGRPVPHVEIRLQSWEDASAPMQPQFRLGGQRPRGEEATTNKDGTFRAEPREALGRSLGVTASVPGYSDDPIKCVLDPERGRDLGDVFLEPAVHVTGWVRDGDDRPVAGARVRRLEKQGDALVDLMDEIGFSGILGLATTDDDGRFELPHEDPGAIVLLVEHDDILPQRYEGPSKRGGEVLQDIVVRVDRAARIEGHVVGYPRGRERGMVVATIVDEELSEESHDSGVGRLISAQMGGGDHSAEIAADGSFVVPGLLHGAKYEVRAIDRQMFVTNTPVSEPVVAVAASPSVGGEPVSLQFDPGTTMTFQVVDRSTERPIEALTVSGRFGDRPALLQLTETAERAPDRFAGGKVTLYELRPRSAPATLTLTIDAPGYFRGRDIEFQVPEAGTVDVGKVELDAAPRLRFRVVDASTNKPVKRARVTLSPANAALGFMEQAAARSDEDEEAEEAQRLMFGEVAERSRDRTDRDGRCELTALEGSPIVLEVRARKYARYVDPNFTAPSDGEEIVVELVGGGSLLAYVVDAHGDPASDVRVEVKSKAGAREKVTGQRTAEDGIARFEHVGEGIHDIRAFRSTFGQFTGLAKRDQEWTQVEVVRGVETRVDLAVPSVGDVTGLVLLGDEPAVDARVTIVADDAADELEAAIEIQDQFGGLRGSQTTALTDVDGRFELNDVEPGDYALLVRHDDVAMVTRKDIQVVDGVTEVDVEIPATTLEGRVVDDEGKAIEGARINIVRQRAGLGDTSVARRFLGNSASDATTDASGRYRLIGVQADAKLDVYAYAEGYAEAVASDVVVSLGETRSLKDLELERAGAVLVTLEDATLSNQPSFVTAEPVGGRALETGAKESVTLMRSGRARVDGLMAGEWRIGVRRMSRDGEDPQAPEPKTVTVAPGETVEVTL